MRQLSPFFTTRLSNRNWQNGRGALDSFFGRDWSPFSEFESLFPDLHAKGREFKTEFRPVVEVKEDEKAYVLGFDLPGVLEKDISVTLESGVLAVKGERKEEIETQEKDGFYHSERAYGQFMRSFQLPETVEADKIDAKFKDGVLTITLPKAETVKTKTIEIKS